MSLQILILILTTAILANAQDVVNLKKAFTENQIVPDVLKDAPQHLLLIKYPKSGKTVNLGDEIAPIDVKEQPQVNFEPKDGDFHTLILTDPDAPSRANPIRREFRHWLVVNIPGSDTTKGQTLSAYVGSGPPKGSGLHRYTFVLYKQPRGKINFNETVVSATEIGDRPLFSTQNFAEKYGLELESGNFFQAQYDDSVPALHKQLGIKPVQ
ncbi:unnamed protein product [Ceutorhynchus assimilis]|uniref:Phosphatidylethanolamine-binding protein n=1 Tax=Ceutorhynchus assimilis TaxID=467358 RepID=A0A9N9QJX5_9CUCU|nr:unnamed protein product [Ceutorhynchus assimilis]